MSWLNTMTIDEITRYLDLSGLREKLVAGNIANIDTPGYQTQDINFQQALQRASQMPEQAMLPPRIDQVQGLIQRPDGNNVSLDRESIVLAGVQLEYRTAIALLRQEFNRISMAISGNNGA